jgi:hypothetical protein
MAAELAKKMIDAKSVLVGFMLRLPLMNMLLL